MGIKIPGLDEAMEKLDETAINMLALVEKFDRVIDLLEEQNKILSDTHNLHTER